MLNLFQLRVLRSYENIDSTLQMIPVAIILVRRIFVLYFVSQYFILRDFFCQQTNKRTIKQANKLTALSLWYRHSSTTTKTHHIDASILITRGEKVMETENK